MLVGTVLIPTLTVGNVLLAFQKQCSLGDTRRGVYKHNCDVFTHVMGSYKDIT